MSEKFDILYDIDMQLYNEFNDTLCEINEHLGDIYSYKDKADVEDAEKSKEIQLLREAVKNLQKELEQEKEKNKELLYKLEVEKIDNKYNKEEAQEEMIPKYKIRAKIEELKNDEKNIREKKHNSYDYDRSSSRLQAYLTKTKEMIKRLEELLEE